MRNPSSENYALCEVSNLTHFVNAWGRGNKIESLRVKRDWSQEKLAEMVNSYLEEHPRLRKTSKKNADGLVDQQTIQRLEKGAIEISARWKTILCGVFEVPPWAITGTLEGNDDEEKINFLFERAPQEFRAMIDSAINLVGKKEKD